MTYGYDRVTASVSTDLLDKIVSFCTARGWTLHDDMRSSSPPYIVLHSAGESGNELIYTYISSPTPTTGTMLVTQVSVYWNATTHSGTGTSPGLAHSLMGTYTSTGNNKTLFMYGDKDFITIIGEAESLTKPYTGICFGVPCRRNPNTYTTLTATASAGTNVTISVADTSIFTVGRYYFIRSDSYYDWVIVNSIDAAVGTVTVNALGYTVDAATGRFGVDPQPSICCELLSANTGWLLQGLNGSSSISSSKLGQAALNPGVDLIVPSLTVWPIVFTDESTGYTTIIGRHPHAYGLGTVGSMPGDRFAIDGYWYRVFHGEDNALLIKEDAV